MKISLLKMVITNRKHLVIAQDINAVLLLLLWSDLCPK